jgi:hypothetical protein
MTASNHLRGWAVSLGRDGKRDQCGCQGRGMTATVTIRDTETRECRGWLRQRTTRPAVASAGVHSNQ